VTQVDYSYGGHTFALAVAQWSSDNGYPLIRTAFWCLTHNLVGFQYFFQHRTRVVFVDYTIAFDPNSYLILAPYADGELVRDIVESHCQWLQLVGGQIFVE
jgi:hypothetical protein